eukprot:SAG31_NODE_24625_length_477_cov_1.494709_1_plen_28_part_01
MDRARRAPAGGRRRGAESKLAERRRVRL